MNEYTDNTIVTTQVRNHGKKVIYKNMIYLKIRP